MPHRDRVGLKIWEALDVKGLGGRASRGHGAFRGLEPKAFEVMGLGYLGSLVRIFGDCGHLDGG